MKNTDCKLTADNFEYAVSLNALLVALFRFNGEKWEFVRTAKRSYGIAICHLEQSCGDDTLLVFPIGMLPDQRFSMQVHLSNRHRVTPFQLTNFDL